MHSTMKSFILVLVIIGSCSAGAYESTRQILDNEAIRQGVVNFVSNKLLKQIAAHANELRIPILTPIEDDPFPIVPIDFEFPIDGLLASVIQGTVSLRDEDAEVSGTSTITDDLSNESMELTYTMTVPDITAVGDHEIDLRILEDMFKLQSNGEYSVNLVNGALEYELDITLNELGGMSVASVSLDLNFDSITIFTTFAQVAELDGEWINVDWSVVNPDIKPFFDEYWPSVQPEAESFLKDIASEVVQDCNWYVLVSGDYSCLTNDAPLIVTEPSSTTVSTTTGPTTTGPTTTGPTTTGPTTTGPTTTGPTTTGPTTTGPTTTTEPTTTPNKAHQSSSSHMSILASALAYVMLRNV